MSSQNFFINFYIIIIFVISSIIVFFKVVSLVVFTEFSFSFARDELSIAAVAAAWDHTAAVTASASAASAAARETAVPGKRRFWA